jgi:hypothetical protein
MDSFKKVTITIDGYSIDNAHKALLTKAVADFPNATDAALCRMLGVSTPTITKWCRDWNIQRGPKLTKKVMSAIQLLRGKGFSITSLKGVPADRPDRVERRGGAPGRKKTYVPFESIEQGKYITVKNLGLLTVKNYGVKWLREQPDPTIKFRFAEDAEGVKVFRV